MTRDIRTEEHSSNSNFRQIDVRWTFFPSSIGDSYALPVRAIRGRLELLRIILMATNARLLCMVADDMRISTRGRYA